MECTYYLLLTPVALCEIDVTFHLGGEARTQCCQEKEGMWQASWLKNAPYPTLNTQKVGHFHYLMEAKTVLNPGFV